MCVTITLHAVEPALHGPQSIIAIYLSGHYASVFEPGTILELDTEDCRNRHHSLLEGCSTPVCHFQRHTFATTEAEITVPCAETRDLRSTIAIYLGRHYPSSPHLYLNLALLSSWTPKIIRYSGR
ncbi:hypothetical protein SCLCIDRAFT_1219304 [Scleroderma citrinum Foug A]|uniref:Uncharacterized protein n=1 Tax=Scleroderma citrinum Foug A TaxID=1036808 RepID=A0A0C2Z6K9_9AGAM|nr:hypothetical protein SCLCIDRAFT_1219304 [Scleroderma citrinum Foug A]